jgi:hypothetical protein
MGSFIRRPGSVVAAAVAGATLAAVAPAMGAQAAAQLTVACSANALAAAITAANSAGSGTIVLPSACTFNVSTPATAADGLPIITGRVTISGGRNTLIRRVSASSFRLFEVAATGTLILNSITIKNGNSTGIGGGILNNGTLLLSKDTISDNNASNGGGLSNAAGATARISDTVMSDNTTTGVGGGAFINFGSVTVTGGILDGNRAPINGGGINTQPGGTTRLFSTTVDGNRSGGLGGGLSNLGTTSLTDSTVQFNRASGGGGIATGNTNVTLRRTTVTRNTPDNCNPLNTIPGCVN